jgi:hypothetical protein
MIQRNVDTRPEAAARASAFEQYDITMEASTVHCRRRQACASGAGPARGTVMLRVWRNLCDQK